MVTETTRAPCSGGRITRAQKRPRRKRHEHALGARSVFVARSGIFPETPRFHRHLPPNCSTTRRSPKLMGDAPVQFGVRIRPPLRRPRPCCSTGPIVALDRFVRFVRSIQSRRTVSRRVPPRPPSAPYQPLRTQEYASPDPAINHPTKPSDETVTSSTAIASGVETPVLYPRTTRMNLQPTTGRRRGHSLSLEEFTPRKNAKLSTNSFPP